MLSFRGGIKADLSGHLRGVGWWASYDRPYFPEVRAETGHAAAEAAGADLHLAKPLHPGQLVEALARARRG